MPLPLVAALIVTCLVLLGLIMAFAGASTLRLAWDLLRSDVGIVVVMVTVVVVIAVVTLPLTNLGGGASIPPSPTAAQTPSGAASAVPIATASPGGLPTTHLVQPGDTLRSLAATYYGDENEWQRIYDANRALIPDPDQLVVGRRLTIPSPG